LVEVERSTRRKENNAMKLPTKLLALAAAGVVLTAGAVGAVGYVSAQEGGSTPQAQDQTLKDDFLNKLAA
jgi:hypothetical protein